MATSIYNYLKKDHRAVNALFKKIMLAEDKQARFEIYKILYQELMAHAHSEQKTFYKALNKTKKGEEEAQHATHEHKEIEAILKKLLKPLKNDLEWLIVLGELKYRVEHHVNEEETEIFPIAKKIISTTQEFSLTNDMILEKEKIILKF